MTIDTEVPVLVDRVASTLVLSLNRPARRNSIDVEVRHLITDAVEGAASDRQCRSVVLTGSGGCFSAGGDLSSKYESGRVNRERMHALNDVVRAVSRSPKPVIAAVEGPAYGAGLALAAIADFVVASGSARFCAPFAGMGLTADGGLHHSLPQRIGHARARRMILMGTVVDAELASRWGLVDVEADTDALSAALELAETLHSRAPLSVAASKSILARGGRSLDDVLDSELAAQVALMDSEDFHEGRSAFFAKRTPQFTGR